MKFRRLFEPFNLAGMQLKNHIVMPAMSPDLSTDDGRITQTFLGYWEARARGGPGLMIAGYGAIEYPRGVTGLLKLGIDDDKYIPGLTDVASISHKYGARVAMQLNHAGAYAQKSEIGVQPVGPSAVIVRTDVPHELTVDEIHQLVRRFAEGAQRALTAGYDAIEIHAATGYLIDEFLSPAYNKRTDEYGGDLNHRAKFLLDILAAIRAVAPKGFPIWVRINGTEYGVKGGITVELACELAQILEKDGVPALNITYYDKVPPFPVQAEPAGSQLHLGEAMKKAVKIPIMLTGRMTPEVGEKALADGKADLVIIGKQLFADPELPNKVLSGKLDDIRPCTSCWGCGGRRNKPVVCVVNPDLGREREYRISPAMKKKKVMIIGGGPAGMQAAIVAAQRGHKVTLYEKAGRLGGNLERFAALPNMDNVRPVGPYFARQVNKAGVKVELGKEVTLDLVKRAKPDAIVLAAGTVTTVPDLPGMKSSKVITVPDVIDGKAAVGQKVVIVGGDMAGCETAELLAAKGKKVTVVEESGQLALKLAPYVRQRDPLVNRLVAAGVEMVTSARCLQVTDKGLEVEVKDGRKTIEADTIVLALFRSNQQLLQDLKTAVPEVHLAGDCAEPRDLMAAIHEGAAVGHAL